MQLWLKHQWWLHSNPWLPLSCIGRRCGSVSKLQHMPKHSQISIVVVYNTHPSWPVVCGFAITHTCILKMVGHSSEQYRYVGSPILQPSFRKQRNTSLKKSAQLKSHVKSSNILLSSTWLSGMRKPSSNSMVTNST